MTDGSTSTRSVDERATARGQVRGEAEGQGTASKLASSMRRGTRSDAVAGILGCVLTLSGLRAVRRGNWNGALVRLFFGGLLTARAAGERRRARDRSDAATVARPEIGAQGSSREPQASTRETRATGAVPEADEMAAGSHEAERQEPESQEAARQGSERTEIEGFRRMGAAAFDRESGRVPAPQQAFDMEYLVLNGEVYWGVRESDGVVVVSQRYDPMEDREDERYVASSQVDDERKVKIPDTVLDHWDEEAGGGVAVESGDDVVFARAEDLEADDQLAVVPEEWSDDLFDGEG